MNYSMLIIKDHHKTIFLIKFGDESRGFLFFRIAAYAIVK